MTRPELLNRVAEELAFKEISTGAQNDLQRATDIAMSMVAECGMSDRLGLVTFDRPPQPMLLPLGSAPSKPYSEEKAGRIIDEEVIRVVEEAHERVQKILNDLTRPLFKEEIIQGDELRTMLSESGAKNAANTQACSRPRTASAAGKEQAPDPGIWDPRAQRSSLSFPAAQRIGGGSP
jgi:cell division protease FtsH